jgi:tight adherence protein C
MPILLALLVLMAFGVGVIGYAIIQNRRAALLSERLTTFTDNVMSLEELELQLPFSERVLQPVAMSGLNLMGRLMPSKNAAKIKNTLEQAGNPNGLTPTMFVGIRIVLLISMLSIFFIVTTLGGMPVLNRMLYTILGGALGFLLPGMWLGNKIKARKTNIVRSMPDALDLLTISVEAGLGFDLALQRVATKWDNELSKEFLRVLSDTRLGIPRRESMRAMAQRCGVDELSAFVSAIVQAEQLGVSIAKILKVQSEQMRLRRRQHAEALAHQAAIKMLFPMAFLIFPSILVIILGPAVPQLMGGFTGG